jgi:hypothetical protein
MNKSNSNAIDPESVKLLSKVLDRQITPEKATTHDYNLKFVSKLNSPACQMMEVGMKNSFQSGDGIKMAAWLLKHVEKDPELSDKITAILEDPECIAQNHLRYPVFQFNSYFAGDIGCKYLLRTEEDDTFEKIFSEIKSLAPEFMSIEEFELIEEAIEKAQKRIFKEKVMFLHPHPHPNGISGKHRNMTASELSTHGFSANTEIDIDERTDDHDLVSLKELAYVMNGNDVDLLSPFASAFLKYMPEINELGIRAIVFEVTDSKLKSIKLSHFEGKDRIPYGPIEAAIGVLSCFPHIKTRTDMDRNTRYYASISGYIAAPENKNHYGYTEMVPKLNRAVPAGECMLFNQMEDGWRDTHQKVRPHWIRVSATRLYFYPYKPSDLHPYDQTMTANCGQSDNMFNSCAYDPKSEFYNNAYEEKLRNWKLGFDSQPNIRYVFTYIIAPAENFTPPGALFYPWGKKLFGEQLIKDLLNGLYGDNDYIADKYEYFAINKPNMPTELAKRMDEACFGNYYIKTLPAAITFHDYHQQKNAGLGTESIKTTFHHIPECDTRRFTQALVNSAETVAHYRTAEKESKATGNSFMSILKRLRKAS